MSDEKEITVEREKETFKTFTKTWKLFGIFYFSITKTVTKEEMIEDISQKVLADINVELDKKFASPPRKP